MNKHYSVKPVAKIPLGTMCIFAPSQERAAAIALVLNDGERPASEFSWLTRVDRPASKVVDWWCIYKTPWTVVPSWAVEPGETYFGSYDAAYNHEMWTMAARWTSDGPGKVGFKTGPCREPGRLALVQRDIPMTVRGELGDGEAFVYLDNPDIRIVVADRVPSDLPKAWMFSSNGLAMRTKTVFRIPHWNEAATSAPVPEAAPVAFDPLEHEVATRRLEKVDGVDAAECLWRYENAMRNECLARTPGGLVSTHGDYALNEQQVVLAQGLWQLLRKLKARDARRDAVEKERTRVVCEDSSEL